MYINISSCSNCHMGPGVELVSCDLLREGAPIEPVPPVTHWKPDAVVRETTPTHDWAVDPIFFIYKG